MPRVTNRRAIVYRRASSAWVAVSGLGALTGHLESVQGLAGMGRRQQETGVVLLNVHRWFCASGTDLRLGDGIEMSHSIDSAGNAAAVTVAERFRVMQKDDFPRGGVQVLLEQYTGTFV